MVVLILDMRLDFSDGLPSFSDGDIQLLAAEADQPDRLLHLPGVR